MAKGIIEAGVCGMRTEVTTIDNGGTMKLSIDSECPHYQDLAEEIGEIDGMMAAFDKVGTGSVYEACRKSCPHGACPVPMGILKVVEVGAGMALPGDVSVKIEK